MKNQEETSYHASLLAYDCGLGKTLTTLLFIHQSARHKAKARAENATNEIFRATLLIVPAPSIDVWHADKDKFFGEELTLRQFYGNDRNISINQASTLITGDANDLQEYLNGLDPSNPKVS